jgi:hypothetical protein
MNEMKQKKTIYVYVSFMHQFVFDLNDAKA